MYFFYYYFYNAWDPSGEDSAPSILSWGYSRGYLSLWYSLLYKWLVSLPPRIVISNENPRAVSYHHPNSPKDGAHYLERV